MYLFQVMSSCKLPCAYETSVQQCILHACVLQNWDFRWSHHSPRCLHSPFRFQTSQRLCDGPRKKNKNDWALVGRNTVPRIPSYLKPLFFNHTAGTLSALLLRDRRVWQCKSHLRESTFQWKPHFPWVLTLNPREWRCICDPQTC